MKITKSELKTIIREEAFKFKKKLKLEQELSSIQSQLDEVHAGGEMESEKNDGVHAGQKKSNFKAKSKNGGYEALVEEEDEEMDEMTDESMDEMTDESMDEMTDESMDEEESDIDISEIFAEMDMDEMTDESDESMDEMTDESMDEMTDESMDEMTDESMDETDDTYEGVYESRKSQGKIINEEQSRMRELAGIKSLNS